MDKVLIVDDDSSMRYSLNRMLEGQGLLPDGGRGICVHMSINDQIIPHCGISSGSADRVRILKESVIDWTYSVEISPIPSLPKRGIPPFGKGRAGGIWS